MTPQEQARNAALEEAAENCETFALRERWGSSEEFALMQACERIRALKTAPESKAETPRASFEFTHCDSCGGTVFCGTKCRCKCHEEKGE